MRYAPWGAVRYQSGSLLTRYTYTGQYTYLDDFGLYFYNARWYDPQLGRFAQPDSIIPDPAEPLSWERYAYVLNNPLKFSDPSGHCAENGDEACWGVYEEIIHKCPECAHLVRATRTADLSLSEEKIAYLQIILAQVNDGWRPNFNSNVDGTTYGWMASGEAGGIGGVAGFEVVRNKHNGATTLFFVIGGNASAGVGASTSVYGGPVYNIGEDNLTYAGNFVSVSGTLIAGFGYTGARAVVPKDNVFEPRRSASDTLGFGIGAEVSASAAVTEYIPLVTWDKNNISVNVDDYFLNPDFANRGVLGNAVYYWIEGPNH